MHRLLIAGAILGALAFAHAPVAAAQGTIASGKDGSLCIDIPRGDMTENSAVVVWGCHGASNQQITLQPNGHLAVNGRDHRGYQMCLDHYPSGGADGAVIRIWPCHPINNPNDSQRWTRTASGELRASNGKCLALNGGQARQGNGLILWPCHGGADQRWTLGSAAPAPTPAPAPAPRPAPAPAPAPTPAPAPAPAPVPAAQVKGLYVIDGTGAKAKHQNIMWHFYQRFEPGPGGVAHYWDGVTDVPFASDASEIFRTVGRRICNDVKPKSEGGYGVTDVFIAGYSRGAMISVRLANEVARCGAQVKFLGLVDAVNTSLDERVWPIAVRNRTISQALHIEKPNNTGATVLGTRSISGVRTIRNPWVGGAMGIGAVSHEQMTCPVLQGGPARWNEQTLVTAAERAGATFKPALPDTNNCSL